MSKHICIAVCAALVALAAFSLVGCGGSAAAGGASVTKSVAYSTLDSLDLATKTVGVETGTIYGPELESRYPGVTVYSYNSSPDLILALQSGKVDAIVGDSPTITAVVQSMSAGLSYVSEELLVTDSGLIFNKSDKGASLQGEFNAFLASLQQSGELSNLKAKWCGDTLDDTSVPDIEGLSAENGTITFATQSAAIPFDYIGDNEFKGYEVELVLTFCKERGYGLEIMNTDFSGILSAVEGGKADIGASGMSITEERKKSVLFSSITYTYPALVYVRQQAEDIASSQAGITSSADMEGKTVGTLVGSADSSAKAQDVRTTSQLGGFFGGLAESFRKTFVDEGRWQLFLGGIGNTLLITVLSLVLATALGFGAVLWCRNGGRVRGRIVDFAIWLIQGMPIVVFLMILFYIVFGSVSISGVAVSIIGFTLIFATSVVGLLRVGISSVDQGQEEAAQTLGYSRNRAFFRIVLPQAIRHVLGAYRSEMVSLLKGTAVVGYIAVQDLTKIGDIIRSRTYEAFFPLIAVAVIYFILAALLKALINVAAKKTDPFERTPREILRGIEAKGGDAR